MNACAGARGLGPRLVKGLVFVSLLASAGIAQAELYWRADVGYSFATDAKIQDKNPNADFGPLICGDAFCSGPGEVNDVGSSPVLSAGIGWRFSESFRTDLTFAYRGGYKLDDSDAIDPPTHLQADIESWNLMLNGYWDFTASWGKPYIGFGIGHAENKVKEVKGSSDFLSQLFGINAPAEITVPGGKKSDFAWSLMAGVAIPINAKLMLDIGYRYVDLGRLETRSGVASISVLGLSGTTDTEYPGASGKLRAHELTIGLRF